MYLEEQDEVPWIALRYILGTINYGGRVTDFLDLRCVNSILNNFFTPAVLTDEYKFSTDGVYHPPVLEGGFQGVLDYIKALPRDETPEVFGLHPNAQISFQSMESKLVLDSIILMQPRGGGAAGSSDEEEEGAAEGSGGSKKAAAASGPDVVVNELATEILAKLPAPLDRAKAHPSSFARMPDGSLNSLGTVLSQEVDSFNKLLRIMRNSLGDLQKAIKGLVVMSAELEAMYVNFLYQKVPNNWAKAAYPSTKPLNSWVADLVKVCGCFVLLFFC